MSKKIFRILNVFIFLFFNLLLINENNVVNAKSIWFSDKEPVEDYAYSFAIVGDTQSINEVHPEHMKDIYNWILENKEEKKIAHVMGLGDIKESWGNLGNSHKEWANAKESISLMDGKIPYSLARGNHDEDKLFNEYFGYDEYIKQFDGFKDQNKINNSYKLFTVANVEYLLVVLDFAPTDEELEWAKEVIESYPNHKVIITTHVYMYSDGLRMGANNNHQGFTYTDNVDHLTDKSVYNRQYNVGEDIWNKLVSKCGNVVLVLSGHIHHDYVVYRQDEGLHGNVVTQMLINPQAMDRSSFGACGMVCMLYFSNDGLKMSVEYISTVKKQYFREENQYSVDISKEGNNCHNFVTSYDDELHWEICDCGEIYYGEHKWENSLVTKEPTYIEEGEKTITCNCGATKIEIIPKLENLQENKKTSKKLLMVICIGSPVIFLSGILIFIRKKMLNCKKQSY